MPKSTTWTLTNIKAANEKGGGCFFGPDEMRIWGDTMASFTVVTKNGRIFIKRVKAAKGFDGKRDPKTVGQIREFYPETGRIGVVLSADRLKEEGLV